MHGTRDVLLPVAAARKFVASQPELTLHEVPDGRQLLFYTHPELVARLIIEAMDAALAGFLPEPWAFHAVNLSHKRKETSHGSHA